MKRVKGHLCYHILRNRFQNPSEDRLFIMKHLFCFFLAKLAIWYGFTGLLQRKVIFQDHANFWLMVGYLV